LTLDYFKARMGPVLAKVYASIGVSVVVGLLLVMILS
jgi:hypothetical protein